MKIKIFYPLLVIFFLIIFFIFYKGLQNNNTYKPNIEINKDIPNFKAKVFSQKNKIIDSNEIFIDDKFYLLNIWASWCIPCREEHSFLINLNNQNNLEIVGLNYKDIEENAQKFLNELNNPYKIIISDDVGLIAIEWGAYGVPETFLIHEKKIIKRFIGPLNQNSLNRIKEIIR